MEASASMSASSLLRLLVQMTAASSAAILIVGTLRTSVYIVSEATPC